MKHIEIRRTQPHNMENLSDKSLVWEVYLFHDEECVEMEFFQTLAAAAAWAGNQDTQAWFDRKD